MAKPKYRETLRMLGLRIQHVAFAGSVFAMSLPTTASAQSAVAVETLGARPCETLLEAQQNDEDLYRAFGMWIGGFLTAANAYEDDTFDLTPWQPIEYITAQVTSGCRSNPEATVAQTMNSYVGFLRNQRLTQPSKLVRVQANDNALFIYETVLAQIRDKLTAQGFTITDPENTYRQTFGQAILAYQRRENLSVTGLPDVPTLAKLLGQ